MIIHPLAATAWPCETHAVSRRYRCEPDRAKYREDLTGQVPLFREYALAAPDWAARPTAAHGYANDGLILQQLSGYLARCSLPPGQDYAKAAAELVSHLR